MAKIKIGINCFGGIGRTIARVALQRDDVELAAINDPVISTSFMVTKFKNDKICVHGDESDIQANDSKTLLFGGKLVSVFHIRNPEEIPWHEAGVQFVLSTKGNAKDVVVSAPIKGAPIYVVGANKDKHYLCDTNNIASLAKVIHEDFGITDGSLTTVHAITAAPKIVDGTSSRRTGTFNMVPSGTEAAKVSSELDSNLVAMHIRVPTWDLSSVDLAFTTEKAASYEDIKNAVKVAAEGNLKGIMSVVEDSRSNEFGSKGGTAHNNHFIRLVSQFDDDWAYCCKVGTLSFKISTVGLFEWDVAFFYVTALPQSSHSDGDGKRMVVDATA